MKSKPDRPSKVLFAVRLFPPAIGGTATLYYNICKRLGKDKIVVITERFPGWKEFDRKQGFRIYRVKKFSHIDYRIFKEVAGILYIIIKERINKVIYGHINFCLTALVLKYVFGIEYYLYIHGEEITQEFGGRYYRYFKYKALREAKGIIAISEYTRDLVKPYNNNVKVIYNAVDLEVFRPEPKRDILVEKYNLRDKFVLLTIGRLEDRKGHDMVIRALPDVLEKFPNVVYLIGGEGKEEGRLRALVRELGLNRYVFFLGRIPPDKLVDYYNLCDIFIMPNRQTHTGNTEGFGIVFLEANACGKPVIGGMAGGVPSAIKDGYNGFLVDGQNPDEIKEKIKRLLRNDDEYTRISNNALKWVNRFTYTRLINELKEFLFCNYNS